MPDIPPAYLDLGRKAFGSLVVVILAALANRGTRLLLRRHVREASYRQTLSMLIRNGVVILAAVILLAIWLGFGSSFTVAMGILGAGIAFASQEVIGSLAGYLNILTGGLFRIGDRVQIGHVVGDVLDINPMRTMVMEIGEWVRADQYTGRVVSVANRAAFTEPVINYTRYWPYLWDELMLPITYGSNWQKAAQIILDHGQAYSAHVQEQAREALAKAVQRYPVIERSQIEPSLYVIMTDNWIELTLRYVVEPRERRSTKDQLHRDLLRDFSDDEDITIASATYEIVGFPPLRDARHKEP